MNYVIQGQTLTGIADAIRAQLGTEQQYTPESMAAAIGSIKGSGDAEFNSVLDGSATSVENNTINFLRAYIFNSSNLQKAVFSAVVSVGAYIFQNSKSLVYASLPSLQAVGSGMFFGCSDFEIFETFASAIYSNSFATSGLKALILNYNGIVNLQSIGAIENTPIASGTGYIYVPDDLVDKYKVATNWATYASQIKGLSEIPAEVQEWIDQQGGASA